MGTTLDNINQTELMWGRGESVSWGCARLQSWGSSYQTQLALASNPLFNFGELLSWGLTRTEFGIQVWVPNIGGGRTHNTPIRPPEPSHKQR